MSRIYAPSTHQELLDAWYAAVMSVLSEFSHAIADDNVTLHVNAIHYALDHDLVPPDWPDWLDFVRDGD